MPHCPAAAFDAAGRPCVDYHFAILYRLESDSERCVDSPNSRLLRPLALPVVVCHFARFATLPNRCQRCQRPCRRRFDAAAGCPRVDCHFTTLPFSKIANAASTLLIIVCFTAFEPGCHPHRPCNRHRCRRHPHRPPPPILSCSWCSGHWRHCRLVVSAVAQLPGSHDAPSCPVTYAAQLPSCHVDYVVQLPR